MYDQAMPCPRTNRGLFMNYLIIVLLLIHGILAGGCLAREYPASSPVESGLPGPEMSGYFLYQNAPVLPFMNVNETAREDTRASAIAAAMDSRNPVTRDFAASAIPRAHGGAFNAAQACDLWESVYSRWTYVEDPGGDDYLSPASRTITLGLKGDCDDFAIVVAALIGSVGGDARVVYSRNGTAGHAYPEVFVGTSQEEFDAVAAYVRERYGVRDVGCHVTREGPVSRYWLNLDWWSSHPGGQFYADDGERTAYYPDGRWERVAS